MTQLGDYHVNQPTGRASDSRSRGPTIAVAVIVLIALGFSVYWYMSQEPEALPPEVVANTEPPVAPPPLAPVEPEPEPIELPTLDDSDAFVRDLIGMLSSHPGLASWLVTDGMIRRFVVVVDNVASGNNPSQHLRFMQAETPFRTTDAGATSKIDPASYARYDLHASIIDSLDIPGTAEAYATLEPLMNEAYVELGYPDTFFIQGLERAIAHLLQIQSLDLREPPSLVERGPFFNFTDPMLESLSPAQKQFLGMGPKNVRIVQAKIRQIAIAIGIPNRQLP